jgi:diacylglycerol O-acyltransferase / wax synthase
MDRMSPQDASFLHIEDANNHMHVGSVAIFEGPAPDYEQILASVRNKLPFVPRYRQKVRFLPLDVARPVWVSDPNFNLEYHVRHTALPAPGGEAELRRLVGRLMSQQLDRSKPLWEMWIAEGLEEGRWAMVSKIHHCMVDGVSGSDLMTVLLDVERNPEREQMEDNWQPEPEPSMPSLVAQSLAERIASPYEGLRTARSATRAPRQLVQGAAEAGRGLVALRGLLRRTPPSSLSTKIGPHRRWAWARSRLADVKQIRAGLGGTVNDVVLAAITNGFRELLLARGEPVEEVVIRSLIPVSVRRPEERGTYNNKVSAMFAELPVGVSDPVARLNAVHQQMKGLKESKQAVAGERLTSLSGFAPPLLLALGTRLASRVPQRNLTTVTTNVPGPQTPLYASGQRMLECFPYVPLAGTVSIGVAIFSYDGALNFGVTGDYDKAPDIDLLCRGIEDGVQQLLAAASTVGDGAAARSSGPGKKRSARRTEKAKG